ncbi:uncharacterized protein LOC109020531 [Juglans regia]|uniref:Uncharacterized protein LOC109020531 n=2 Tax=Juglans regia TaxID=51240 RepID=A0A2I4HQY2_JUGRE|nr:uncharacterized protein LOC109020531 [Juglans regia]
MEDNPRAEAERLLGIAEKLLHNRDLVGSRDFAILAQETEPLLEGSDQILAVVDVLLAAEKRINNHLDWYSILQIDRRSDDPDLIKKQYRRLALLLHPDKNKFPLADQAFKLVADAWAVFNDHSRKSNYDNELGIFAKVDLNLQQPKLPVRRSQPPINRKDLYRNSNISFSSGANESMEDQRLRLSSFWTMCPYCYNLYEYPRVYEGCCLRCQSCHRAFEAVLITSLPPLVPGQDAYYCCWGAFPMGFVGGNSDSAGKSTMAGGARFPNWTPSTKENVRNDGTPLTAVGVLGGNSSELRPAPRKRGRPRKNPVQPR